MASRFTNNSDPTQSGRNGYEAVPGADALPVESRQLYIKADGNLEIVFAGYKDEVIDPLTDSILFGVVKGERFDWAVSHILAGTTAEVLVIY